MVGQEDGDAQLLLQLMTASHVQRRSPNDTEHSLTVWWTAPYRLGLFAAAAVMVRSVQQFTLLGSVGGGLVALALHRLE